MNGASERVKYLKKVENDLPSHMSKPQLLKRKWRRVLTKNVRCAAGLISARVCNHFIDPHFIDPHQGHPTPPHLPHRPPVPLVGARESFKTKLPLLKRVILQSYALAAHTQSGVCVPCRAPRGHTVVTKVGSIALRCACGCRGPSELS